MRTAARARLERAVRERRDAKRHGEVRVDEFRRRREYICGWRRRCVERSGGRSGHYQRLLIVAIVGEMSVGRERNDRRLDDARRRNRGRSDNRRAQRRRYLSLHLRRRLKRGRRRAWWCIGNR